MAKVKIYPPSNCLINRFQEEKARLTRLLSGGKIEHFGSTAIPGVYGKGVIDIMVAFSTKQKIDDAIKILTKNGYLLLKGNQKTRGDRIFFSTSGKKESSKGDIHLHLVLKGSQDFKNALLFRDYLIKHPQWAKEYSDLKFKLQKQSQNREQYTQMKKGFIDKVIALAIKDKDLC